MTDQTDDSLEAGEVRELAQEPESLNNTLPPEPSAPVLEGASPFLPTFDSPTLSTETPEDDGYLRDEQGGYILNKDGSKRKKRGRKPGQKSPENLGVRPSENLPGEIPLTPAPVKIVDEKAIQATSATLITVTTSILAGVIGDEWRPENKDEFDSLNVPLAAYLRSKDISDVPPGVLLAMAIGAYSLKRLQTENTRTKLGGIIDKGKFWFAKMMGRIGG